MALPCSIRDVDDKLDVIDFAHWILICDSYLTKAKHLLAINHYLYTLSNTCSSASIPTKLSLVHETISIDDGIVFKIQGKVHVSNSTRVTGQAFQATGRQKTNDCDNDTIQALELHNQAYVAVSHSLETHWICLGPFYLAL